MNKLGAGMKTLLITFLLTFALTTFSNEISRHTVTSKDFQLTTINYEQMIVFDIYNLITSDNACQLLATKVSIEKEIKIDNQLIPGTIKIDFAVNMNNCTGKPGLNHGSIALKKGPFLPGLPKGIYNLIINGEHIGVLTLIGRGFEIGNG